MRLTEKKDSGSWRLRDVPWDQLKPGAVLTQKTWEKLYGALWKLKDYEDSGLSPEQIGIMKDDAQVTAKGMLKKVAELSAELNRIKGDNSRKFQTEEKSNSINVYSSGLDTGEQTSNKNTSARVNLIPLRVDVGIPEKSEDGAPIIKVKDLRAWAVSQKRITNKALRDRFGITEEQADCVYTYLKSVGIVGSMGYVM